ncbi:hypothetical protein M758_3G178600 [Ceratodon purpureus]|nr:hypothetical protein M758_3G178600 [Ceratodon purpureus]
MLLPLWGLIGCSYGVMAEAPEVRVPIMKLSDISLSLPLSTLSTLSFSVTMIFLSSLSFSVAMIFSLYSLSLLFSSKLLLV